MVRILANAHICFGIGISGFTFMQTIWMQIKKDYKDFILGYLVGVLHKLNTWDICSCSLKSVNSNKTLIQTCGNKHQL